MRTQNQGNDQAVTSGARPVTDRRVHLGMDDFARRVLVVLFLGVVAFVLTYTAWRGLGILLPAFAGVLFAVFLATLAEGLSARLRLPYLWSVVVVVLGLLLLTGVGVYFLANQVAAQARQLSERLPESLTQLRSYLAATDWGRLLLAQQPNAQDALARLGQFYDVRSLLAGVTSFLVAGLIILFVGIFGAAEPHLYLEGVLYLAPPSRRQRLGEVINALVFNLRWWLVGQAVLMLLMWLVTTVGLWALGIPFALALGLLAGVLELVPYVGPWLSAVPAALIAITVGPTQLVEILVLYLILHVLEGYLLAPLIQRGVVFLPPALTIVVQLLLGELLGPLGLFVAAPLTLCVVVVLKMLYVEDALGDEVNVPGEPGNEEKPTAQQGAGSTTDGVV